MEHLISPKLTPGVHCLSLRHKGMFIPAQPDPEESASYDTSFEGTAYWCSETQVGFGPDGRAVNAHDCKAGRGCCRVRD